MRGKKGIPHRDPADPPRRRGNKQQGHGTWWNDRPPIAAVFGRQSRRLRLRLVRRAVRATLEALVLPATRPGAMVYSDEWGAYKRLPESGRVHASVNHEAGQWARDDDGDGVREVHDNTLEGIGTGFRIFLRPFRGVSKWYLGQYAAMVQWGVNLKSVTDEFLALLLGRPLSTIPGT